MKYRDIQKSGDRGPRKTKTHVVDREGDIMLVATKKVVSTHPTNSIRNVAKLMKENDFRRIPVTDAGTQRFEGIVLAIDILDFLGGGEKYNIIEKDYKGNFLAAINCPAGKIMKETPQFLDRKASVEDAVKIMINRRTSAIPIVNDEESRKVVAIVTERDVLPKTDEIGASVKEAMQTDLITSSPGMMISDVSKIMVRNRYRRLPVILEDKIVGIVTVFDILKFLGYGDFKDIDAESNLSRRVEEIMEKEIVTLSKDDDLGKFCNLVKETGLGGFPVVDGDKLEGLITTTDLLRWVYENEG